MAIEVDPFYAGEGSMSADKDLNLTQKCFSVLFEKKISLSPLIE